MDTEELYSENKEIQESNDEIIKEIKKFNWGAFGLSWIWGIFNKVYTKRLIYPCIIVFIFFILKIMKDIANIPIIGIPLCIALLFGPLIYFGKNGNAWAWEENNWYNIERFRNVQKRWAIATLFTYLTVSLSVICFFIFISAPPKDNYTNTAKKLIYIIMSDFNCKNAESGAEAAKFLVDYLNESQNEQTNVVLYNGNTLKFSVLKKSQNKYKSYALYTINKKKICSLNNKNCFISAYMIKNNKPILVSKTFFDNNVDMGTVKYIKYEN